MIYVKYDPKNIEVGVEVWVENFSGPSITNSREIVVRKTKTTFVTRLVSESTGYNVGEYRYSFRTGKRTGMVNSYNFSTVLGTIVSKDK